MLPALSVVPGRRLVGGNVYWCPAICKVDGVTGNHTLNLVGYPAAIQDAH